MGKPICKETDSNLSDCDFVLSVHVCMKKNRISEEKEEIILIRYYKFVSLQRVINTTSNGKVTNGRTPEEMDDIIRHYISGAVRVFFSFMKIQN